MRIGSVELTPRDSQRAAAKVFGQAQSAAAYRIRDFLMRSVGELE
jgi:hypothetical protein